MLQKRKVGENIELMNYSSEEILSHLLGSFATHVQSLIKPSCHLFTELLVNSISMTSGVAIC